MRENEEILTIPEVAAELRCSKAHVYKVVNGRVAGVSTLPSISLEPPEASPAARFLRDRRLHFGIHGGCRRQRSSSSV